MKIDYTGLLWKEYVLFDIETAPKSDIADKFIKRELDRMPAPRDPLVQPFKIPEMTIGEIGALLNACAPTKEWIIGAVLEEGHAKDRKGVQSLLKKAISAHDPPSLEKKICLMPELCEILCIGMSIKGKRRVLVNGKMSTQEMLEEFWKECNLLRPCGWNISGFDLPVILHRTKECGVDPTRKFEFTYSGDGFLDLLKLRKWTSGSDKMSDVALALGFDGDDNDPLKRGGADVYQAWKNDDMDSVVAHCETDLARLEHVFFNYIGIYL
jgi:hypothetical protein